MVCVFLLLLNLDLCLKEDGMGCDFRFCRLARKKACCFVFLPHSENGECDLVKKAVLLKEALRRTLDTERSGAHWQQAFKLYAFE